MYLLEQPVCYVEGPYFFNLILILLVWYLDQTLLHWLSGVLVENSGCS